MTSEVTLYIKIWHAPENLNRLLECFAQKRHQPEFICKLTRRKEAYLAVQSWQGDFCSVGVGLEKTVQDLKEAIDIWMGLNGAEGYCWVQIRLLALPQDEIAISPKIVAELSQLHCGISFALLG